MKSFLITHYRTHSKNMRTAVTSVQFDKSKIKNFTGKFSLKFLIMEISTYFSFYDFSLTTSPVYKLFESFS